MKHLTIATSAVPSQITADLRIPENLHPLVDDRGIWYSPYGSTLVNVSEVQLCESLARALKDQKAAQERVSWLRYAMVVLTETQDH